MRQLIHQRSKLTVPMVRSEGNGQQLAMDTQALSKENILSSLVVTGIICLSMTPSFSMSKQKSHQRAFYFESHLYSC
jgi:hypothetical protein